MTVAITIRRAEPEDFAAVQAIYAAPRAPCPVRPDGASARLGARPLSCHDDGRPHFDPERPLDGGKDRRDVAHRRVARR